MKNLVLIISTFITFNFVHGQFKLGLGIKTAMLISTNGGRLNSLYTGFTASEVLKEREALIFDLNYAAYAVLDRKHVIKFNWGNHKNGSKLDIHYSDDVGSNNVFTTREIYKYKHLGLSYSYRIMENSTFVPIEVGLNVNKFVLGENATFNYIKKHTADIKLAIGIHRIKAGKYSYGLNGIYLHNITEYLGHPPVYFFSKHAKNSFKPRQLGLEFVMNYEFGL